ncbi:MAG: S8 family serine peptidase [Salinibacter sp.]
MRSRFRPSVCAGLLALLLAGLLGPDEAFAAPPDSSRDAPDRYWIMLAERPGPLTGPARWTAPVSSAYLARLTALGIEPVVRSRWFHAVSAPLSAAQRARVRALPIVRRVAPVASGRPLAADSVKPRPQVSSPPPAALRLGASRSHLARMNAVAPMTQGLDGRGVRVGFLDASFRGLRHPAFAALRREGRLIALRDFTDGTQRGNHGMGVASVAVGRAPGSLVGPAHGAEVLGATTEYTPSERNVEEDYFVAGLEWLHRRGADVVNVSIGYNTFDQGQDSYTVEDLDGDTGLTTRAVDRAARLGVTVVVSAGNSGCASPDSCWYYVNTPADADSAIAVGAIRPDSSLAPFSSRGPTADGRHKPDVVVQGTGVTAAWTDGRYARVGGTSFASPQVTGVVAQMLQMNPDLSPTEVRTLLRRTASRAGRPNNRMGWGIVNATAALQAAERRARATPPATLRTKAPTPNPAADQVTVPVRVPHSTTSVRLALTSPLGRTAAADTFAVRPGPNWLTLDVSSVPPGLYRYRVQGRRHLRGGSLSIDR